MSAESNAAVYKEKQKQKPKNNEALYGIKSFFMECC